MGEPALLVAAAGETAETADGEAGGLVAPPAMAAPLVSCARMVAEGGSVIRREGRLFS